MDSFIPLWEWDIPKKKSKKRKSEKGEKKEKGKSKKNGTATVVEEATHDSDSQPIRGARIEEVPDEDA